MWKEDGLRVTPMMNRNGSQTWNMKTVQGQKSSMKRN